MKSILRFIFILYSVLSYGQSYKTFLFVGSYTNNIPDTGIYIYELSLNSGKLLPISNISNIVNPSYITISNDGSFLYACTDTKLATEGSVTSFKFDSIKGKLELLNKKPAFGINPVYVTTSKSNNYLINASYTSGSCAIFKLNPNGIIGNTIQSFNFTGSSINKTKQNSSHIHSVVLAPDNDYLLLPDLGADKIRVMKYSENDSLPLLPIIEYDVITPEGSGPRHLAIHPNKQFIYCTEELSGKIGVYKYSKGKLTSIQRINSYSKTLNEYATADIHISPDGQFLYASNRDFNENSISIFSIDTIIGTLRLVNHIPSEGKHPRNFALDPTGKFLLVANQLSNSIIVFSRDLESGLLTHVYTLLDIPNPSCLKLRSYKVN